MILKENIAWTAPLCELSILSLGLNAGRRNHQGTDFFVLLLLLLSLDRNPQSCLNFGLNLPTPLSNQLLTNLNLKRNIKNTSLTTEKKTSYIGLGFVECLSCLSATHCLWILCSLSCWCPCQGVALLFLKLIIQLFSSTKMLHQREPVAHYLAILLNSPRR